MFDLKESYLKVYLNDYFNDNNKRKSVKVITIRNMFSKLILLVKLVVFMVHMLDIPRGSVFSSRPLAEVHGMLGIYAQSLGLSL